MNNKQITKLEWISYGVVGLVALISFILSFENIKHVAEQAGYDQLGFLVPFIIDFFLISVAVVSLNVAVTYGKSNWVIKALIGMFVGVSITFNYLDATETLEGRLLALLIPFALFASFEVLIWQIKTRMEFVDESQIEKLQIEKQELENLLINRDQEINTLNRIISELKAIPKLPDNLNPFGQDFIFYLAGSVSIDELIETHQVSKNWIGRARNRMLDDLEEAESNQKLIEGGK